MQSQLHTDHEFQAPLPKMFSSYPYHPILSSFSLSLSLFFFFFYCLPLYVLRSKVMAEKLSHWGESVEIHQNG